MAIFRTIEHIDDVKYNVEWHNKGEIIHQVDCHNYDQIAFGYDQNNTTWVAVAEICCGEIQSINDPEIF